MVFSEDFQVSHGRHYKCKQRLRDFTAPNGRVNVRQAESFRRALEGEKVEHAWI